jgi:hypothetical protein
VSVRPYLEGTNADSFRILEWWGMEPVLFAAGRMSQALVCVPGERVEEFRAKPVPSLVGPLEHVAIRENYVFCVGKELAFGCVARGLDSVYKVNAGPVSTTGVTAVGFCGLTAEGHPQVAIGYQDGRLIVAELVPNQARTPDLEVQATVRTSMGAVVAIQALGHGRAIAIDADFRCVMLDTVGPSVLSDGRWELP